MYIVGIWVIHVYFGDEEVQGSPISLYVNDPQKAWLSGPEEGCVGEMVAYKGIETKLSVIQTLTSCCFVIYNLFTVLAKISKNS